MHKIAKKVYISMLTVVLVCITMFATTYAWVGMLSNSTFDEFNIDFSVTKLSAYDVELSLTGEQGSFGSTVNQKELKKVLLTNMGYSGFTDQTVDAFFKTILLDQVTVKRKDNPNYTYGSTESKYLSEFEEFTDSNGNVGNFIDMDGNVSKKLFTFDLYVSVAKAVSIDSSEQSGNEQTDYALDIYLEGDLFSSKTNQKAMINEFSYPSEFVNTAIGGIKGGTMISGNVRVKPEYACRISIQKYETVEKYHPEKYDGNNDIKSLLIYEGGSHMPVYYNDEEGYSFGGILEDNYNLALCDYNKINKDYPKKVPQWALERGDIEYNYNDLNQIIDKSDKVSTNSMVKLKVCFWFEGWDSDCFSVIDRNPVDLKFMFTTKEKFE